MTQFDRVQCKEPNLEGSQRYFHVHVQFIYIHVHISPTWAVTTLDNYFDIVKPLFT